MRHRHRLAAAVLVASAVLAAAGCSSDGRHGTADSAPSSAGSTTPSSAGSPAASPTGSTLPSPTTAGTNSSPTPTQQNSSPAPGMPAASAAPKAAGVDYNSAVDVAAKFTAAYYTYDWQQPATLDPIERARPYTTDGYLATLQPTRQAFPARMTAAQETSAATIRSAAVDADAPPTTDTEAFVTVAYGQHLTDRGQPTDNRSAWSLHLVKVAGAWRVDRVVARS